ncbi:DNA-binding recombinase domain-containing protein [Desulfonema limicola]|uniref:DNA-binding recombinase domain-containing protein n=1 Tax=Desulfonema limicola TaxID=45656 RepID=A0A975BCA2_9BACT|nr:recombinase family protein [Desulfonema limicola]QTA82625.1 DNA-binding recombinase domain-containing protein [Desulfonema limicola]
MNDFLKSLRSNSKDKRFDRSSRRPYNPQYNGNPQYRSDEEVNGNLKRGHLPGSDNEKLTKLAEGFLPEIKTFMESIAENQKRMTDAEERKAEMLAEIAKSLQALLKSGISLPLNQLDQVVENQTFYEPGNNPKIENNDNNNPAAPDRETILNIIFSMREKGTTFGEIASFLDSKNIPTFSKKGTWHAQTIHRICKKMNK